MLACEQEQESQRESQQEHQEPCVLLRFPVSVREPERFNELVTCAPATKWPTVQAALELMVAQVGACDTLSFARGESEVRAAVRSATEKVQNQAALETATLSQRLKETESQLAGVHRKLQDELCKQARAQELAVTQALAQAQAANDAARARLEQQLEDARNRQFQAVTEIAALREQAALQEATRTKEARERAQADVALGRAQDEVLLQETRNQLARAREDAMQEREQWQRRFEQLTKDRSVVSPHVAELLTAKDARLADERAAHERHAADLRAALDALRADASDLSAQLKRALACVPQSRSDSGELNNSQRGEQGEKMCRDLLRKVFNGDRPDSSSFSLTNISRDTGGCGDIELRWAGVRVCVEVKNYNNDVDTAEIDTFRTRLAAAHNVAAGIFISLGSRVAGTRADYAEELLRPKDTASGTGVGPKMFLLANLWSGNERERQIRVAQLAEAVRAHAALWLETNSAISAQAADAAAGDAPLRRLWRAQALEAKAEALEATRNAIKDTEALIAKNNNETKSLRARLRILETRAAQLSFELEGMHVGAVASGLHSMSAHAGDKRPRSATSLAFAEAEKTADVTKAEMFEQFKQGETVTTQDIGKTNETNETNDGTSDIAVTAPLLFPLTQTSLKLQPRCVVAEWLQHKAQQGMQSTSAIPRPTAPFQSEIVCKTKAWNDFVAWAKQSKHAEDATAQATLSQRSFAGKIVLYAGVESTTCREPTRGNKIAAYEFSWSKLLTPTRKPHKSQSVLSAFSPSDASGFSGSSSASSASGSLVSGMFRGGGAVRPVLDGLNGFNSLKTRPGRPMQNAMQDAVQDAVQDTVQDTVQDATDPDAPNPDEAWADAEF